jgi:hypothetical protein
MGAWARTRVIAAAASAVAALAPTAAQAAAPRVQQLVAFRDGSVAQRSVTARAATARVGGRRCAVGESTPLAALIRSAPGALKLKDYGSCSKHPRDAAGLYVASIRSDRARGVNGWVYKVGNKVASAGAGDPSGPFGRGRLRSGARVTWFYCHMSTRTSSCQRTLGLKAVRNAAGVTVTVSSYDDRGRAKRAAGATVHAGAATATTDANGVALLPADATRAWAESPGTVRSFEEQIGTG